MIPLFSGISMSCPVTSMSYSTQWCQIPTGASGSSTIKTSETASGGMLPISKEGEMFSPSQVYLLGISAPSAKERDTRVMGSAGATRVVVGFGSTVVVAPWDVVVWSSAALPESHAPISVSAAIETISRFIAENLRHVPN